MTPIVVLLLALGVSMDAFSAAVANGIAFANPGKREAFLTGAYFGFFQAAMPFFGYLLSSGFSRYFEKYIGIIGFVILFIIGMKMIYQSVKGEKERERKAKHKELFILAIATSIDALAVGITFAADQVQQVILYVLTIGIVTFITSFCGVFIGKRFHTVFSKAEMAGGAILLFIGLKMLLESGI